ncbi:MAG: HAD family hydrolase [Pirellulaceae bacterium]|nr:HAD family hydrolase [Pirellulaceae bacterium]
MPLRAVFFDFDFTLADSTAAAVECTNHALVTLGYPAAEREAIRKTVAYPLPEVFARLTGIDGDRRATADFVQTFISHADQVMAPLISLFPGAAEAVAQLRRENYQTAIVSTKFRYRIETVLANHSAGELFDLVVGGEDVERHKPHPDALHRALDRLRLTTEQVLYVGDHPIDAQAARAAGIPFVAMLTGASVESDFDGLPRRGLLTNLAQLPRWLRLWRQFEKASG